MQAGECYTYPRVGNMYETARHNIVYGEKKNNKWDFNLGTMATHYNPFAVCIPYHQQIWAPTELQYYSPCCYSVWNFKFKSQFVSLVQPKNSIAPLSHRFISIYTL